VYTPVIRNSVYYTNNSLRDAYTHTHHSRDSHWRGFRSGRRVAGMRIGALGVLGLLVTLSCSSGARIQPVDAYRGEQAACVAAYATRAEIDACRERVREEWGVAPRQPGQDASGDGGAGPGGVGGAGASTGR